MTISIPTTTQSRLLAYHHEQDGVKGYLIQVGPQQVFVEEAEADRLARYMLFTPPVEPEPIPEPEPLDD